MLVSVLLVVVVGEGALKTLRRCVVARWWAREGVVVVVVVGVGAGADGGGDEGGILGRVERVGFVENVARRRRSGRRGRG